MDWTVLADFLKHFAEAISPALQVLLESVLVYLAGRGALYFRAKYETVKSDDLDLLIAVSVKAAEQIYGAKKGEEKKRYVLNLIQGYAGQVGLKIDPFILSAKVEAAVVDAFNHERLLPSG
jgi:hypothetical protein